MLFSTVAIVILGAMIYVSKSRKSELEADIQQLRATKA